MGANLIKKIKNPINYFFTSVILFVIKLGKRKQNEKTLLLIRLDAIGDYILFRNFIEILRNSEKYKHYRVTLCGNVIWKSLAETFDNKIADDFIWVDRKKFYSNFIYKYQFLNRIYRAGYETIIEATHSREILFGDTIVNGAKSKNSIGSIGSGEEFTVWKRKMLTNKLYSQLIEISNDNMFEFEVNKELFSKLLEVKLDLKKPYLDTSFLKTKTAISKHILLFPGSSDPKRMWSEKYFKTIAEYLILNYDYNIVISGSNKEAYLFNEIVVENYGEKFYNLFGNTLPELAKLIADSELLISNDTSAVHFAAAVNTPFICISNGSYFGRFNPYPLNIYEKAFTVYPSIIRTQLNDVEKLKIQYRFNSDLDINEIKPQVVIELLNNLLKP